MLWGKALDLLPATVEAPLHHTFFVGCCLSAVCIQLFSPEFLSWQKRLEETSCVSLVSPINMTVARPGLSVGPIAWKTHRALHLFTCFSILPVCSLLLVFLFVVWVLSVARLISFGALGFITLLIFCLWLWDLLSSFCL